MYIWWCLFKYTIFTAVSFLFYLFYYSKFLKNLKIVGVQKVHMIEPVPLSCRDFIFTQILGVKKWVKIGSKNDYLANFEIKAIRYDHQANH
ncbi:hypothetical protein HMPREF2139_12435 [Prevotella denticola DNF00960]|nr:hypothetical protein HMPREF2139_12435 [Prevotella denticola DNF00960]